MRRKTRRKKKEETKSPETQSKGRKQERKQEKQLEDTSDFSKVGRLLDKYNIPELESLPEELEPYLEIDFYNLSNLTVEDIHTYMGVLTYQLSYIDMLCSNAEIEVRNLEREFTETWHNNYEGQNKKMNAEFHQLKSGVWENLDIARGVLRRVEVEKNRLESNYRFYSRMLSSRQGGLG